MAPWLRMLEPFLVQQLLRTPAFHRVVEKVAKGVHRVRHGTPPEELGGTKIDGPNGANNGFLGHFLDEVKTQLGNVEGKGNSLGSPGVDARAVKAAGNVTERHVVKVEESAAEDAEAAWREMQKNSAVPPKQGFLGEYAAALRQQVKAGNERKT
ncbi:hypothetical protein LTR17_016756 [Elasticomyces elasticus]|nr:hypothetical protein LTR17_016756 [Elasticomyces elasticus]